ncbi:MAG: PGF-pre-PGF domain-containing protein, partial [Chloroflexi bacterium]|nr:PGF-pre-PGF domain-containing protein [Chloroflexota bacterium]
MELIEEATPEEAAQAIIEVEPERAGVILDQVTTEKVVEIVALLGQDALLAILPQISPQKLMELPVQLLFDKLPQVPADLLVADLPPQPDPTLPLPTAVQVTPTLVIYTAPLTGELTWTKLVGSPAPIESILGKFQRNIRNVEVTVEDLDELPPEAPGFDLDEVLNTLFRIEVENASAEDIVAAFVTVFVSKQWVEENDINKWSIRFNRFDERASAWVPFPARRAREDEERIYYSLAIPGFSVFAITGSPNPPSSPFRVSGLAVSPPSPVEGEDIAIRATVENTGASRAVYPANLWVDGTIEDSNVVAVDAGSTAQLDFTLRRPAGAYSIRIDRLFADVAVSPAAQEATPTPTPTAVALAALTPS